MGWESYRARECVSSAVTPLQDAGASIEAGAVMVLITNPVWLVKTRLQLYVVRGSGDHARRQRGALETAVQPYSGMFDAFVRIVQEEGVLSLYRGVLPSLLLTSHGAIQLVVFACGAPEPFALDSLIAATSSSSVSKSPTDLQLSLRLSMARYDSARESEAREL